MTDDHSIQQEGIIGAPVKEATPSSSFQERELQLKEKELELKAEELELRRQEMKWRLWIPAAISASAVVAGALITYYATNAWKEKEIAVTRARLSYEIMAEEVKQFFETADPATQQAILNRLEFYLDAGLIEDPKGPNGRITQGIRLGDLKP